MDGERFEHDFHPYCMSALDHISELVVGFLLYVSWR